MAKPDRTVLLIEQELRNWRDVTYEITHSGTHPRVWVHYGPTKRFLPFSSTKTDPRGMRNKISQLRKMLRDLGAERTDV